MNVKLSPQPLLIALFVIPLLSFHNIVQAEDQLVLRGIFSNVWGDDFVEGSQPQEKYFVTSKSGRTSELIFNQESEQILPDVHSFNGREVQVTVKGGAEKKSIVAQPYFIQHIELVDSAKRAVPQAKALGAQPWVTIMCKFSDVSAEPRDLNYFTNMYSSSYPGMDHYWREASYNRVNLSGSTAHGWYTLPKTRSQYLNGGNLLTDLANDCTAVANADVYFPGYVGINMMFNDDLDGYAWGGSRYINIDGQGKTYRVTWEPPWGYKSITVIAHEMGHGFGMPHSSGNYGQTYDNVWDVMSNSWANCGAATHPTYGCLGQQTIGYHRDLVGWLNDEEIFVFDGTTEIITLEQLTKPSSNNYLLAKIPIGGSQSRYYTVEVRKKVGYDAKLANEAVIIHEVDEYRSNRRDAYIIDIDNNKNTGDAGAIWSVGEKFVDTENSICVEILSKWTTSYSVKIGCGNVDGAAGMINAPVNHLLLR